eukprot:8568568-Pyramimonas_sp.AAC.1
MSTAAGSTPVTIVDLDDECEKMVGVITRKGGGSETFGIDGETRRDWCRSAVPAAFLLYWSTKTSPIDHMLVPASP